MNRYSNRTSFMTSTVHCYDDETVCTDGHMGM